MGHRPDWNNKNFKKGSVRGFADGGDVDAREAARDNAFSSQSEPTVDTYEFGRYDEQEANKARYESDMAQMARDAQEAARELSTIAEVKSEPKRQSFKEAFASAKDGSVFTWENPKTGKTEKFKKEYAKPAPQGDQKVRKMYEDAAKAGRDYRAAAATAKTENDRKILLNAAAESENNARLYGAGYANSAKK